MEKNHPFTNKTFLTWRKENDTKRADVLVQSSISKHTHETINPKLISRPAQANTAYEYKQRRKATKPLPMGNWCRSFSRVNRDDLLCRADDSLHAGDYGGTYAISFADFFYEEDGSTGIGAWTLRGIAVLVGLTGLWRYRNEQDRCSIDPKRQQKTSCCSAELFLSLG